MAKQIEWRNTTAYSLNNGIFTVNNGKTVSKTDTPPRGMSGNTVTAYVGASKDSFEPDARLWRKTPYWGLISNSTLTKFTQVRLWEYWDITGSDFVGVPKRKEALPNPNLLCYYAGYFTDTYTSDEMVKLGYQKLPVFKKYGEVGGFDYNEILNDAERAKFPIGTSGASGESNETPPNGISGGRGKSRGWDGTRPLVTGNGSGTGTTVGTSVTGMPFPDFSGFSPIPPKKSGTKKPGGQYVTGGDGKKYYLPPGLDFSGFKKQPPPLPRPETKIAVRMPRGYAAPSSTAGTKPRMTQRQLDLTDSGQAIGTVTDTFVFPYIPQNIRYSDIGSDWREVPRAMNASFIDWSGYKLMKVSMDFLVTAQFKPSGLVNGSSVSDGLMNSVTDELNMLRRMATNKFPVTLEGFDDILQIQMARSRFEQPRGIQFVIQDLNITAGRRTINGDTGLATNPSLIAAAQVSMTLQEIPVETVTIVKLPPLELGTPIVGKGGGGGGGGFANLGLQSLNLTGLQWEITTPIDPNG